MVEADEATERLSAVVDTNIIAYYLLETAPFYEAVRDFWREVDIARAPDSWRIELTNVMWMAIRAEVLDLDEALERIRLAEGLVTGTVPVGEVRSAALSLSVQHQHPAYDTAFLALAIRESAPLVTHDRKLLQRFPEYACTPLDFAERAAHLADTRRTP